jgi:hypothetical protein
MFCKKTAPLLAWRTRYDNFAHFFVTAQAIRRKMITSVRPRKRQNVTWQYPPLCHVLGKVLQKDSPIPVCHITKPIRPVHPTSISTYCRTIPSLLPCRAPHVEKHFHIFSSVEVKYRSTIYIAYLTMTRGKCKRVPGETTVEHNYSEYSAPAKPKDCKFFVYIQSQQNKKKSAYSVPKRRTQNKNNSAHSVTAQQNNSAYSILGQRIYFIKTIPHSPIRHNQFIIKTIPPIPTRAHAQPGAWD